jgi:CheY-like chemotaxis protein
MDEEEITDKKKLIYLIDDDEDILIILKRILEKMGMEVETFTTPEPFIKRLKEQLPDLCFVDLNLGVYVGAGFQLIQAIRKKISDKVILIILSSRDSAEDTTYALEIGCDDYVVKPIKAAIIEAKLSQHLSHKVEKVGALLRVPSELSACSFGLGYYLHTVNEEGFIILTQHFIPKNTMIEFSSGQLFDVMGKSFSLRVKLNWVHEDSGLFALSFNYPAEDRVFKTAFRNWLLLRAKEIESKTTA